MFSKVVLIGYSSKYDQLCNAIKNLNKKLEIAVFSNQKITAKKYNST